MTKPNNFQRIRNLNTVQKAALAAAVLERMLPNYRLFVQATDFGDADVFRSTLDVCWEKILLPKSKINLEKQIEKIEPNTPELNDFDMFGVYPAIDTATALLSLLHGLMSKEEQEYVNVCKISQASVARVVELHLDAEQVPLEPSAVNQHPLMQYEVEILSELIDFVENMGRLSSENAKELKHLAIKDGQSNIGIEIA